MTTPKPAGAEYVCVPREPNGKMINAAMDEYTANGYEISWTGIYKAMLAASPRPAPDAGVIERAEKLVLERLEHLFVGANEVIAADIVDELRRAGLLKGADSGDAGKEP